ncbi:MAG: twin-arginine translocase TatA/TatE family subunit [Actinomycetota bacterium]|nr:twin-arginine translocase TatA/TatE family subunit [Actinomycetota bacterium]
MLSLDPAKLLVVLLVALVVLGPDKLPRAARQAGAAWSQLRQWRTRLEEEVRGSFPDLPSTDVITQAVRSPLSFLDHLADGHVADGHVAGEDAAAGTAPTTAGALGVAGSTEPLSSAGREAGSTDQPAGDVAGAGAGETPWAQPAGAGAGETPWAQPAGTGSDARWAATDHDRVDQVGLPNPRVPYDALRVGDPSMN